MPLSILILGLRSKAKQNTKKKSVYFLRTHTNWSDIPKRPGPNDEAEVIGDEQRSNVNGPWLLLAERNLQEKRTCVISCKKNNLLKVHKKKIIWEWYIRFYYLEVPIAHMGAAGENHGHSCTCRLHCSASYEISSVTSTGSVLQDDDQDSLKLFILESKYSWPLSRNTLWTFIHHGSMTYMSCVANERKVDDGQAQHSGPLTWKAI